MRVPFAPALAASLAFGLAAGLLSAVPESGAPLAGALTAGVALLALSRRLAARQPLSGTAADGRRSGRERAPRGAVPPGSPRQSGRGPEARLAHRLGGVSGVSRPVRIAGAPSATRSDPGGDAAADLEQEHAVVTVLFTDIVGATEHAFTLGDDGWRDLLTRHHTLVRLELARFGGREIDTAGDGFLAAFETPARAIRCARAIRHGVADLGLEIRAGLHAGECVTVDDKVCGVAVHIGARVAAEAAAGEILVSGTVKELVVGSGLGFDERPPRALRGLPGQWRVFAVSETPAEAA